ncbi:hypothetical protein B0I29_12389 [Actinoplanes lutulentus]|uniref:Uncharacterized protein n=1 Tax=Actinoplanes lutulentus TaxID=1287878 RepID=A0A327Z375_9ACTN|nr:hypothetical protein B0I29_12389 [Actinoplanes lutulentus]
MPGSRRWRWLAPILCGLAARSTAKSRVAGKAAGLRVEFGWTARRGDALLPQRCSVLALWKLVGVRAPTGFQDPAANDSTPCPTRTLRDGGAGVGGPGVGGPVSAVRRRRCCGGRLVWAMGRRRTRGFGGLQSGGECHQCSSAEGEQGEERCDDGDRGAQVPSGCGTVLQPRCNGDRWPWVVRDRHGGAVQGWRAYSGQEDEMPPGELRRDGVRGHAEQQRCGKRLRHGGQRGRGEQRRHGRQRRRGG